MKECYGWIERVLRGRVGRVDSKVYFDYYCLGHAVIGGKRGWMDGWVNGFQELYAIVGIVYIV